MIPFVRLARFARVAGAATGLALIAAACGDEENGGDITDPPVTGSDTVVVSGNITTSTNWTADKVYQLRGIVQVQNAATLTIAAGTKITGSPVTDLANRSSALIIMRGARIVANGTATQPIVFTSAAAGGAAAPRYPGDWGGLVIVGNARSSRSGRVTVEGPAPVDTIQWSGGDTDTDNSGSMRYVRVEFAGAAAVQDVELNSFSFYAVGSGTRLEYLQALFGLDDHFEWFGGTVDGRYLVSYEAGDDHFDTAEGYRGRNQFLIAVQSQRSALRPGAVGAVSSEQNGFEADGCGSTSGTCPQGFNSTPYSMPVFANFTMVGPGAGVLTPRPGADGGLGANIRRGTGGVWINGVFVRYPERAISMFQAETNTRFTEDSLDIRNIIFAENAANYDPDDATNRYAQAAKFTGRGHVVHGGDARSLFPGLFAAGAVPATASLDFRPAAGTPVATGGLNSFAGLPRIQARVNGYPYAGGLVATSYAGAVAPGGEQWYAGWTNYARQ